MVRMSNSGNDQLSKRTNKVLTICKKVLTALRGGNETGCMEHISKHIYFAASVQHFIPTSGVGSFFRGFLRMADHFRWDVSVVLDKKPFGQSREMMGACDSATNF